MEGYDAVWDTLEAIQVIQENLIQDPFAPLAIVSDELLDRYNECVRRLGELGISVEMCLMKDNYDFRPAVDDIPGGESEGVESDEGGEVGRNLSFFSEEVRITPPGRGEIPRDCSHPAQRTSPEETPPTLG